VSIGNAQEKTRVFRTEKRRNEKTGMSYPWLVCSTAMVSHFYVYGVDRGFLILAGFLSTTDGKVLARKCPTYNPN
jgi:hypothetical protein